MSEDDIRPDVESAPEGAPPPASFGARLAAARESAGMSVGDVAARLRLHVNQVRALESEDLARLPETAYVRGFVRSYARALNLDPAPLIEDLNRKTAPPTSSVVDGMARTRDYSPVRAAAREQTSRRLVLGLALVALIVLAIIGWYATHGSDAAPQAVSSAASPASAVVRPAAMSVPAEQPTPAVAQPPAASAGQAGDETAPAVEPAPAPSQSMDEAGLPLALRFNGLSWIEVTDASGKVVVSQLAAEGEELQPAGALPLAVVIGDASKATVTVRGQPFDLGPHTRANVARFSVR